MQCTTQRVFRSAGPNRRRVRLLGRFPPRPVATSWPRPRPQRRSPRRGLSCARASCRATALGCADTTGSGSGEGAPGLRFRPGRRTARSPAWPHRASSPAQPGQARCPPRSSASTRSGSPISTGALRHLPRRALPVDPPRSARRALARPGRVQHDLSPHPARGDRSDPHDVRVPVVSVAYRLADPDREGRSTSQGARVATAPHLPQVPRHRASERCRPR